MKACTILVASLLMTSLLLATSASAQTAGLRPGLADIGFLVGHWSSSTPGKVVDTGETSTGQISFTPEVGGSVLLREDHVSLHDRLGKPAGGFNILMMIYPEAGTLHADYSDGQHVIHYTSALVTPGRSVVFTSAGSPGVPRFRLSYTLLSPKTLDIAFSMAPPGDGAFHSIATGKAQRDT